MLSPSKLFLVPGGTGPDKKLVWKLRCACRVMTGTSRETRREEKQDRAPPSRFIHLSRRSYPPSYKTDTPPKRKEWVEGSTVRKELEAYLAKRG